MEAEDEGQGFRGEAALTFYMSASSRAATIAKRECTYKSQVPDAD